HNETGWRLSTNASRDAVSNFILSEPVSAVTISEILLSDELVILPLLWGSVSAQRSINGVNVHWTTQQESSVDYFIVERSVDGRTRTNMAQQSKATNTNSQQQSTPLDAEAPPQRIYPRTQQFALDGRSTYSSIASVSDEISS